MKRRFKGKGGIWGINLLMVLFMLHMIRDLLQVMGVDWWMTRVGHEWSVMMTQRLLDLVNANYGRWAEFTWIGIELLIFRLLLWIRLNLKKVDLKK